MNFISKRKVQWSFAALGSGVVIILAFQNCAPQQFGAMNEASLSSNGQASGIPIFYGEGSDRGDMNQGGSGSPPSQNQGNEPVANPANPSTLLNSAIVATIYSENDLKTGLNQCATAANPAAAKVGYWDLGNYSYCDQNNIPQCRNGSQKVVWTQTEMNTVSNGAPSKKIVYHTVCVKDSAEQGFQIVSTAYSASTDGVNVCATAQNAELKATGYFDLGGYSYCDRDQIPMCAKGSHKVIMSAVQIPNTRTVKYHTACVVNGSTKSQIVSTMYSETEYPSEKNTCIYPNDPLALAQGYFDEEGVAYCDLKGIPQCAGDAKKVILSATQSNNGNSIKYQTACVKNSSAGTRIVASIYSEGSAAGVNTCRTASEPLVAQAGYFDVENYGYCDSKNIPQCRNGSKKLVMSDAMLPDGTIKYSTVCVQ
ncbi:MAG: hypothetical protein OM95_03515 [Bdellovibrio sp. ArHS]|uniref:hypothetical protein n=1 Tax=Bdellovibrio sp. ArHS TaxID=1569284 RepID=UPI0005826E44|nr:hypothetical protein [Bdellovibrio sp. ArHS]KHD89444.1 MAG: hypothetical protein OM95_03515 [Bdellovibrio sp. ArHS]